MTDLVVVGAGLYGLTVAERMASEHGRRVTVIDSRDHELGREALREAAGSKDEKFSPSKTFQRIPEVYHGFIHYDEEEERYALKISDEDTYWLK